MRFYVSLITPGMRITIPFNPFIFIWSLIGLLVLGYGYIDELRNGTNIFALRSFYTEVFWFLLCLLYAVGYVRNRIKSPASSLEGK